MDKQRATRRIIKRLSNEQQTVDRRESVNTLAGVFVQLKEDEKNREDVGLTEVEAARRRRIRSEDLAENLLKTVQWITKMPIYTLPVKIITFNN